VSTTQTGDNSFQSDFQSQLLPNFGFGLYYSTPKFYAGLSTPRLLENDFESSSTSSIGNSQQRHYNLITGAVFPINESATIKIRPTALFRITQGAPAVLDLTALFYFHDKYWVGPMFRTSDALGVLAGINITDQFSFGYSFDWSYGNQTLAYNAGSHELMLRYDFIFKDKGKILSPRYF